MSDDFFRTLGHDLSNTIHSIVGWVGVLRAAPGEPATVREAAAVIERNVRHQDDVVREVVRIWRLSDAVLRQGGERVELAGVIRAAVDAADLAARKRRVVVESAVGPAGPVRGRADALQHVVTRLLLDALEGAPEGGRVEVVLAAAPAGARVSVVDRSDGVAPSEPSAPRRPEAALLEARLGVGRALLRHLLALQGGSLEVEPPGPDARGSVSINLSAA